MPSFEIISLDLFNTLVYVDRSPSFNFKKAIEDIWKLMDNYSFNIPFEIFFEAYKNNYKAKIRELFAPNSSSLYKELTLPHFILNIFAENGLEKTPELNKLALVMATDYFRDSLDDIYLYPTVRKLLTNLRDENYSLILTSDHSWPPNGHDILEKFDIKKYFDKVTFSGEVGYRKPSSTIFVKSIEGLDLSSRDKLLHVGDDYYTDIRGILDFGGKAIWIDGSWKDKIYSRYGLEKPEITGSEKSRVRAIIPDINHFPEDL
ncbi:MAG: HAD family hydrolase [Candidatus Hodarchaeales archaeon]|jgi:putative hydrolase of the HAD superfamily